METEWDGLTVGDNRLMVSSNQWGSPYGWNNYYGWNNGFGWG